MNPTVRNILAVIAGLVAGSIVNMGIVMLSGQIVAMPEGVDVTNPESLKASMHLFETKHFIAPFLAHAAGTLFGALVASLLAVSARLTLALVIGGLFFLGGIANAYMINLPVWFIILDLVAAYLPMAWLGWKFSGRE